jgi:hypothetical protein
MSLKEKFQITLPGKETGDEPWASFESARTTKNEHAYDNTTAEEFVGGCFNEMPAGMDITNQFGGKNEKLGYSLNGDTTDVSTPTPGYLSPKKGYSRAGMKGTDDQYTGEHIDLFYGEAYGDDGEVGFLERNNYLDRE